ncbi:DUF3592 domain-containing protein [Geomonas sp. Red69]|uniref:DUF3592 domain-containing protein n=1 Tax=Geomonas diazotrophica TaxID=2843197 RepID=UPI001C1127A8|nr:DUF3592 domain-containing protein [Geomonas diazotrophica]MBU5636539.1 DUF3592 domain-containing protein [Geomonas diazotrophica]
MLLSGILTITMAIALYLIAQILLGKAAESWPTTTGKLEKFRPRTWTATSKFPSIQGTSEQCLLDVTYTYEVGGKVYRSRRLNFGFDKSYLTQQGLYRTPEELENDELTKRLKSNNFTVRYWPLVPSVAVLVPGIINERRHYATAAVVIVMGVILSFAVVAVQ